MPNDGSPEDRTEMRERPAASPAATSTVRFAAGDLIAGRFRIVAALGRGGMGEVYRADDTKLGQQVALKFLPQNVTRSELFDRLVTEVRLGRQVAHPNVCRLYDLGEAADGAPFIAMEFVDGEDLSSLLRRIGRVPSDKALALAQDMLSGLAAAHDAGIVHRDLKPANIMIDSSGRARITDFGLAIVRSEGALHGFAGTPAYMAPEQLAGRGGGVTSDIYAAGLVCYEMITGRRLFDSDSVDEIRRAHGRSKPLPSTLVYDIESQFEQAIIAAIDEDPAKRPHSAQAMLELLPRAARTSSTPRVTPRPSSGSAGGDRKSIAVLPFEHVGADAEDESFSIGLAEEIISDLSKIKPLRVISRGSVMRFKGARDIPAVARDLQVAFVLTGSIRKMGNQLRVTANVIDGSNDSVAWSEKFRGTVDDVFDIQEAVAREVAAQLHVKLTADEEEELSARPIPNALAYEYYLKARAEILKFSRPALDHAVDLLRSALAISGENALLLSTIAYAQWQYFNSGIDPDASRLERAGELARRAIALEPNAPFARRVLGLNALSVGDTFGAMIELSRAVAADPNDADAAGWLIMLFITSDRAELARPLIERILQIDPHNTFVAFAVPYLHLAGGDLKEAVAAADLHCPRHRDNPMVAFGQTYTHASAGDVEAALHISNSVPPEARDDFAWKLGNFIALAAAGERVAALAVADARFRAACRSDLQYSVVMAEGLAAIGETFESLDWLENGIERGYLAHRHFSTSRFFAELRNTTRFEELVARARRDAAALRVSFDSAMQGVKISS